MGKRKIGKRMEDAEMIKLLAERIAAEAPPAGTNPLADKMSSDATLAKRFDQVRTPITYVVARVVCCAELFNESG